MKPLLIALLILAVLAYLAGCASISDAARRHPRVTAFIAVSLTVSGAQALQHRGDRAPAAVVVSTPSVDCSKVSCQ